MFRIVNLILFLCLVSCIQEKPSKTVDNQKEEKKTALSSDVTRFELKEDLTQNSKENIVEWDEYDKLADFLKSNYLEVTPSESLTMSKDLVELVKNCKDSLSISVLNTKGVFSRLNVLNSEVLRLKDMSEIPSIKSEDVILQTEKIIHVFTSVNSKINSVYLQKSLDENINFDETIFKFNEHGEKPYQIKRKPRVKNKRRSGGIKSRD